MDSKMTLDDITRELFAQLRGDENKDFNTLTCPKCSDRLQPLLLDFKKDEVDNVEYQTIWWTCRGLKKKTCVFPLNVPKNVFWTRRTVEQMRQGLLPLPNIHLLPEHLHYLYPDVFNVQSKAKDVERISKITTFTRTNAEKEFSLPTVCLAEMDDSVFMPISSPVKPMQKKPTIDAYDVINKELKYGESDSRRNVELFADTNSALSSTLSLRFSTDIFLSTINSEMSRKKLIEPPLAIGQKQRLRFANFVDKYRKIANATAVTETSANLSAVEKLENYPRRKKPTKNVLLEDSCIFTSAMKDFDDSQRARSLCVRLGVETEETEPQNACTQEASTSSAQIEINELLTGNRMPGSADSMEFDSNFDADFRDSGKAGSSTTSPSTDISSTRRSKKKRKRARNDLPIEPTGDAELDRLLQLKYQEVMTNLKFAKRSRTRNSFTQDSNTSQHFSQSLQPIDNEEFGFPGAMHSASEHGYIQPTNFHMDPPMHSDFGDYCPDLDLTLGLEFF